MSTQHWLEVKAVFQQAIELPQADRHDFLQRAESDGHSTSVMVEVRRLLQMHENEAGAFLHSPIGDVASELTHSADRMIGQCIGGFRILRCVGVGGMGAVYEAQQDHPRRKAAVKIMRPGLATPQMLRRFEFEAEILGKLQHPGIAHVYAAGTFDLGDGAQPWFAMELIEGPPLNVYDNNHRLSLRQKLELLLSVCDAVQHAHQRGVVHRDLKPANILVESSGAHSNGDSVTSTLPQPKILDFGVARVMNTSPGEAAVTMHTAAGEIIGTLSYMSPEQVEGNPDAIDARCDVYALGVIGFELLAGRLPHDRKATMAMATMIRAITDEEPTKLGTLDTSLRGDLETIFAKALEKDRERRYQSAADFAGDIRRHLNSEAVLARPATAMYQLRKFTRRNRTLVGGILATILALITGMIMTAVQAHEARKEAARSNYEADKATAINNYITNDFVMKLIAAAGRASSERDSSTSDFQSQTSILIDHATDNIAAMFAAKPLEEAAVRNEVGTIYYNLGAFDKAAEQFEKSLNLWEANLGSEHSDTLKAVNNLGQTFANLRQVEKAEVLYRRGLEGRLRVLGEDDPFTLISMNNLANHLRFSGQLHEAEIMLRRTLAIQKRVIGETDKSTLITMANLGSVLIQLDQAGGVGGVDEAVQLHQKVYETFRRTLGQDHVTTLMAGVRLGQSLNRAGENDESHRLLSEMLAMIEKIRGPDHSDTINARRNLARVCRSLGKLDEAALHLNKCLYALRSRTDRRSVELMAEIDAELNK